MGIAGGTGGLLAGGSLGALAGLAPAPFTAGSGHSDPLDNWTTGSGAAQPVGPRLSIPLGAAVGAGTGLCVGRSSRRNHGTWQFAGS